MITIVHYDQTQKNALNLKKNFSSFIAKYFINDIAFPTSFTYTRWNKRQQINLTIEIVQFDERVTGLAVSKSAQFNVWHCAGIIYMAGSL
jgi:hypothetical protein